jgi:hypothetical protein
VRGKGPLECLLCWDLVSGSCLLEFGFVLAPERL